MNLKLASESLIVVGDINQQHTPSIHEAVSVWKMHVKFEKNSRERIFSRRGREISCSSSDKNPNFIKVSQKARERISELISQPVINTLERRLQQHNNIMRMAHDAYRLPATAQLMRIRTTTEHLYETKLAINRRGFKFVSRESWKAVGGIKLHRAKWKWRLVQQQQQQQRVLDKLEKYLPDTCGISCKYNANCATRFAELTSYYARARA